ncbi:MAG: hypothetical protein ACYSUH_02820, partial [Planctomycetota bacterium]
MKKLVVLLIVLSLAASVHAGLDISFSTDKNGSWTYTPNGSEQGTFSFNQPVGVDNAEETETDLKGNLFIEISDIYVSNLNKETIGGSLGIPLTTVYIG